MITGNLTKVGAKGLGGEIPGKVYIGIQGSPGKTPELSVGDVETLPPESPATVEITGTKEKPILNFGIPQGKPGEGFKEPTDLKGYATEEWVKEGYQPKGDYALRSEIPAVPVQSVNGKTGAVQLSAADVGARPSDWVPTAADVGALPSTYIPPDQTAEQVGADPKGTAAGAVSQHNTAEDAHGDIRLELKALSKRLTAFFDSDDTTLDELSEIVAYITNNKTLIESITTSKVSVTDIIDNLTTNVANKPLSAAQGVVLNGMIDNVSKSLSNYQPKGDYALRSELPTVPTKVSAFTNDAGYLTKHQDISHKLDASALPTAINTALAQAKQSGEFDGKTPVKFVDYWTPADQEEIVQQVITALGTPVFGRIEADKKITLSTEHLTDGTYSVGYEDKDGNWVSIGEIKKGDASYINQLPISKDESGAVYNGTGYKTEYRLGSTGAESAVTGTNPTFITGYIPVSNGQTVRMKNCYVDTDGINGSMNSTETQNYYGKAVNSLYIALYNSSKTFTNAIYWNNLSGSGYFTELNTDSNGIVTQFKINKSDVAFMRFTLAGDAPNAIITVDQPITD